MKSSSTTEASGTASQAVGTVVVGHPRPELHAGRRLPFNSDFVRKVAETYLTRILLMALGLVTTVVVTRLLGPKGRGLYAVATATGVLGVQFGNFGLHTANVYFAARDPDSLAPLVGNSLTVSFAFGGLISFMLAVVLLLFPDLIALHGVLLLLALTGIPLGLAYLLMQNLMLGAHDVRGYNLLEAASKILPLVFIFGLFLLKRADVAGCLGAGVAALAVVSVWTWRRLRVRFTSGPALSIALFRDCIGYAVKAYLAAFFAFLVLRADLFMVQHMLGVEQVGYYSVASSMADYVSVAAVVIGTILFPRLSAMTDVAAKLRLTRKTAWVTAGVLLPFLAISSLLARPVVHFLFGVAFLPAALSFVLLMPGMLFLGIHSVTVQFLNSIGYPSSVVVIWGVCSLLNILANVWVIPRFGICGASVVSSMCYFLAFAAVLWIIRNTSRFTTPSPEIVG